MVHPRKTKPGTVPQPVAQAQAAVALDRLPFGKDLDDWPRQWMGLPNDLPPGEHLVQCFRPFLHHLLECQLSRNTLRKHVNNLWVLGGEIIRKLNDTPSLRKVPIHDLVSAVVEDGGPLPYGCDSETEGRSFESTCRKLRRFLKLQHR